MLAGQAKEVLSSIELDKAENFTAAQIEKFNADPEFYRKFVKTIEKEVNSNFPIVCTGPTVTSPLNRNNLQSGGWVFFKIK